MAPARQEQLFFEAKKVLDKHINYLTKACYYFFRDSIAKRNDECIQILRDYNHHEDSDTLVKRCTDHYNKVVGRTVDRDYGNPYGGSSKYGNSSKSPVRTTSANVASQKRLMDSIEREEQMRQSAGSKRGNSFGPKRSYEDLKNILGFSNRYTYEDVCDKILQQINLHGDLNLNSFKSLFIRQFPEINKYAKVS